MNSQEAIVRIIGKLDLAYGDVFDQKVVRSILEEVLYKYELTPKETSLALLDDMDDKMMLYLATKKIDGLSKRTLESYGRTLRRFSTYMRKDVNQVSTMDIRIYLAEYAKTGVKNSTIAGATDILRGFFGWLEDEEYINKSPVRKVKTIKTEKRIRQALTKEEFEILRGGAKTLRQKALLELLYSTGCRLEEIETMNKSDIDWQKLQINVIGKGNKERTVYISDIAKVHLKKYLMSRLDDCEAVFVTTRRPIKFLGRRSIQKEIKTIMKQSGLKKNVYPHLIRHTFGTHMLNSGMSLTVLQEIMGHESPDVTLIYSRINNQSIEHEYRKYS